MASSSSSSSSSTSSTSNQSQKPSIGNKTMENEEIVRYMSNLPSYLERGKPIQDKALNFGVMDWGRLEQWQYQHHKQDIAKYSPSSSNSSLKPHNVTLQSHLNISHEEILCSRNLEKSQDVKDEKKTTNRSRLKSKECKKIDIYPQNLHENKSSDSGSFHTSSSSSSSKGKMKIQDPLVNSLGNPKLDIKAKMKIDLRKCKEVKVDNSCRNKKSTTKQALFQMAVKNGRPLFTFTVDNNDIILATIKSLVGKDDNDSWIYTFFTVNEVKKKKSGWLFHGTKAYVPNVTAQMMVSNCSISNCREFVLSSVDSGQTDHQILDGELAAIVVRFLRKEEKDENLDCFSMTVILPGGHHSVPSKGEPPSPLIERWRSGGVCDCGGWDVGCRLRILTNEVQSDRRSNSSEAPLTAGKFDLFFQENVINETPFFSLSPLKDGIFSIEYNSSLSLLHAFSICISIIECKKSSQHIQLKTYVAKQIDDDEAPVTYASLPPLSPFGRV